MGMAGTLGYEVHGKLTDAMRIYAALMDAGAPFGILKLGRIGYSMHHTENGFPQLFVHFPAPLHEDRGFMEYVGEQWSRRRPPELVGSMGTDISLRYRNPIECGWGHAVKLDHAFIGRAALERELQHPSRQMVTLEWDTDDVVSVYASLFGPDEPYMSMEPSQLSQHKGRHQLHADRVQKDGKTVGISSGRMYSYYYRKMISLCSIDTALSQLGTSVSVVWGNPGAPQSEIRATVTRFPYLAENRNDKVDVGMIPCRAAAR
jgi:glycine cleavage system aminomethyltransferase T